MKMSLSEIYALVEDDIHAVEDWASEIYGKIFSSYFEGQRDLYNKLKSTSHPITDSELEVILIDIPLQLFTVSEKLSQFKVGQEVTKLRVKQIEKDKEILSVESSATKRKEDAAYNTLEHKLLITVQSAIVERVEKEISFSRELIMGAKKIWDSRRNSENSNPVNPVSAKDSSNSSDQLPDYLPPGNAKSSTNRYIHG